MPELLDTGNVKPSPAAGGVELNIDPTAVIVESGSNSNGRWIRLSDGTQLCWGPIGTVTGLTATATTVQGLSIYAATLAWTFPKAFATIPNAPPGNPRLLQAGTTRTTHLNSSYTSGATTNMVNIRLMCLATFDQAENPYPIAIGRW